MENEIFIIDYMGPGYGYQIKMSQDGILDWSAAGIVGSASMMKYKSKGVLYYWEKGGCLLYV